MPSKAGAWHREGSYDAIAERLFNGLNHQRLLLEYDTERAGGFEPLRFVPKGKIAVLGLITTKIGRVETADELRRRSDGAARYLPLEQLALSPQCGFASSILGNLLTEEEQFRKFDVMMKWRGKSGADEWEKIFAAVEILRGFWRFDMVAVQHGRASAFFETRVWPISWTS